jgi:hypothetical protein
VVGIYAYKVTEEEVKVYIIYTQQMDELKPPFPKPQSITIPSTINNRDQNTKREKTKKTNNDDKQMIFNPQKGGFYILFPMA